MSPYHEDLSQTSMIYYLNYVLQTYPIQQLVIMNYYSYGVWRAKRTDICNKNINN